MTIYFIRHAQSEFNAVFDPDKTDPMIFDSPLSALGISQAENTRNLIANLKINHVIVSPLTRTLETAHLIFGNNYPMTINAVIREQLTHSCDRGTRPEILAEKWPHLDFSQLEQQWWHKGVDNQHGFAVEPLEILNGRAREFVAFARDSGLDSVAIVSHGNFIREVTGIQPDNCQIIAFDPANNRVLA